MYRTHRAVTAGLLAAVYLWLTTASASAHADVERAEPTINGTVPVAPAKVEIWFDEELRTDGTTIQVIGPGGIQVDLGDAAVDLQDPSRRHVTVSLRPDLGPGAYTVQWVSVSAGDGDQAQGGFRFTVASGSPAASEGATPAVSGAPAGTPVAAEPAKPEKGDFDSRAFAISVLAGLAVAALIFGFWRIVRPKNPMFRG